MFCYTDRLESAFYDRSFPLEVGSQWKNKTWILNEVHGSVDKEKVICLFGCIPDNVQII